MQSVLATTAVPEIARQHWVVDQPLIAHDWLVQLNKVKIHPRQYSATYRLFNFVMATSMLILLSPLLLLGMLLVRLSGRGPIFYSQTRMGFRGELFTIYKLRTMVTDAEQGKGAVWAKKRDARITTFGKFLRKTRLDELPQLWNIIRGEMNLIGPRPERPEFFNFLCASIPGYFERLAVKPGLTGWAQISNGYADSVDTTRLKQTYDMHYIRQQNFKLDCLILYKTLGVVFTGKGAH